MTIQDVINNALLTCVNLQKKRKKKRCHLIFQLFICGWLLVGLNRGASTPYFFILFDAT